MADAKNSERVILKILSGVQAAVEVSLLPGEYSFGSGPEDDIQFIDVSMKPVHGRLRVEPGKIEIKAEAGSLYTADGLPIAAGGEWQEIQPLEIITAGMIRFALGPPTAQWSTITEDHFSSAAEKAGAKRQTGKDPKVSAAAWSNPGSLTVPLAILIVLLLILGSLFFSGSSNRILAQINHAGQSDFETVRQALDQLPFGKSIDLRQEADTTIYATGYVESPVERRAIINVIEKSGVPVRVRIEVLQILRSELDNLIAAEKLNVTYSLSPDGSIVLEGTILDEQKVERLVSDIRNGIIGLKQVSSNIKTAKTYLADIENLAHISQIDQYVVFHLAGEVVEANGVISPSKVDAWVGFLQTYSKRFGKDIGLRSFVQLQNEVTHLPALASAEATPIYIGVGNTNDNAKQLDIDRLTRGQFLPGDLFAKTEPLQKTASPEVAQGLTGPSSKPNAIFVDEIAKEPANLLNAQKQAVMAQDPAAASRPGGPAAAPAHDLPTVPQGLPAAVPQELPAAVPRASSERKEPGALSQVPQFAPVSNFVPASNNAVAKPEGSGAPPMAEAPVIPSQKFVQAGVNGADAGAAKDMTTERANNLINSWLLGRLSADVGDVRAKSLQNTLDVLASESRDSTHQNEPLSESDKKHFAERYQLLFAKLPLDPADPRISCRQGSRLTTENLPAVLFWLDLLSMSSNISLSSFDRQTEGTILEAALNPSLATVCLKRSKKLADLSTKSVYLAEMARNPDFVNIVTRNVGHYALHVSGASLAGARYIETKEGDKMREGMAPDTATRIDLVGELGLLVQGENGFSTVIYNPGINWISQK